jgi:hypothetical protein
MIRRREKKPGVFKAAGKLGELLPKAGSLLVGLTGIAYFAGWRNIHAYYDALGAPWAVSSLPASTFLATSAGLIVTILFTTFLAVIFAEDNKVSAAVLGWTGLGLIFLAIVLARVGDYGPAGWLSEETIFICAQYGSALMATMAGVTFAQLSVQLSDSKHKWSTSMAFSMCSALFLGLYAVPAGVGKTRAEQDLNPLLSTLALVELADTKVAESRQWRLVDVFGANALVVGLPTKVGTHTFRLVAVKDLATIHLTKHDHVM